MYGKAGPMHGSYETRTVGQERLFVCGQVLQIFFCPCVLCFHAVRIFFCGCVYSYCWRCCLKIFNSFCCCCYEFYDKNFPPCDSSLGQVKSDTARYGTYGKQLKNVTWVRASEFAKRQGKMRLFSDKISSRDICQGQLGDCWLLAAMSTLAEWPGAIERMFITKEVDPRGKFRLRLFDPAVGRWKVIIVDDYIPVDRLMWENRGIAVPKFTKPNQNEMWVMILEKAFAKMCGSYAALEGGQELWALGVMTGGDHSRMYKKTSQGNWKRLDMMFGEGTNRRAASWKVNEEKLLSDQLWDALLGFYQRKSVMCVAGNGGGGVVSGHSYSVLRVTVAKRIRFVELRNPWGQGEWQGPWSDNSPLWQQNPAVAKALNFQPGNDGAFWMSWVDFIEVWNEVSICHRSIDIHSVRFQYAGDAPCDPCIGCIKGCSRFWCCCEGCARVYCPHRSDDSTLKARKCCTIM
eukprot:Filipodium_phascolosomae@DN3552_c0_g1_i1.p1